MLRKIQVTVEVDDGELVWLTGQRRVASVSDPLYLVYTVAQAVQAGNFKLIESADEADPDREKRLRALAEKLHVIGEKP